MSEQTPPADTQVTVTEEERDLDDSDLGAIITMLRGGAWVLLSIPEIDGDGSFGVKVETAHLDLPTIKALLKKTWEAMK